jgi:hypothetical protein
MGRVAVIYEGPVPQRNPARAGVPDGAEIAESFADATRGERDGFVAALEAIAAGRADTLCVQRLEWIASSSGELLAVIHWLDEAGASLIAADVGLDTRSQAGRSSMALLREIDRWGREGERPRGRPGIKAGSPELAERIAVLRSTGLSLQAIADQLNELEIPTPRGGSQWRPSSVQSLLGYRRPRPRTPGAPPPPPPVPPARPGRPGRPGPPGSPHGRPAEPGRPRKPGPPKPSHP